MKKAVLGALLFSAALLIIGSCSEEEEYGFNVNMARYKFRMRYDESGAEDFIAITSNDEIIEEARAELSLPAKDRALHIDGPIGRGNGGHNLNWDWHFLPDEWSLAQASIELCDGDASMVQADLDYWVDTLGIFCPWQSYVIEEVPF